MDKPIIHSRSDAFFTYAGDVVTIEHQNNLFNKMTINWRDPLMYLVEVYKNDESDIRVLLDTKWAYYFLVKDEKVIHPPLYRFDVARQLVDEFNYIQWRDMQNTRGLPKKQFISDVMGGQMMVRRKSKTLNYVEPSRKVCPHCGRELNITMFGIRKIQRNGKEYEYRVSWCKLCTNEASKRRYRIKIIRQWEHRKVTD